MCLCLLYTHYTAKGETCIQMALNGPKRAWGTAVTYWIGEQWPWRNISVGFGQIQPILGQVTSTISSWCAFVMMNYIFLQVASSDIWHLFVNCAHSLQVFEHREHCYVIFRCSRNACELTDWHWMLGFHKFFFFSISFKNVFIWSGKALSSYICHEALCCEIFQMNGKEQFFFILGLSFV